MRKRGLVLAIATTLLLSYFPTMANAQDANPYEGLRALALQFKPGDLGIKTADATSPYGLIMDMGVARGTATLAAFSSGDASFYLSSGGGIIGGVGHASVREATRRWLHTAEVRLTSFAPATEVPLPAPGHVRLSVLTNRGTLTAIAPIEEINAGKLELSPVWYEGQRLLTALRESQNKAND